MRANSSNANFNDCHKRDHHRQQEKLNAVAGSADKVQMVSADQLIENLLKDPFKKSSQTPFSVQHVEPSNTELPLWLQCDSDEVPAHYKYLWSLVQSTINLADTQKVSQLLLTSGLQVDTLGFIWSLANKKIPGQLTKQEFYIVLALISLAQSGYTFNNLSILKLMTIPLIPVLQAGLQKHPEHKFNVLQNSKITDISPSKQYFSLFALQSKSFMNLNENERLEDNLINSAENAAATNLSHFKEDLLNQKKNSKTNIMVSSSADKTLEPFLMEQNRELHRNTNFPFIGSSPTAELEDEFSAFQSVTTNKNEKCKSIDLTSVDSKDDFTEFQSAIMENSDPFETVVINQKREVPKIPFPKAFAEKFTNLKSTVLKISPESEKKLKVLSPSESLSSLPESKISSSNKVSTSLSVLGSNHEIGNRLANHSVGLGTKLDRSKYLKYHKINLNSISPMNSSLEDEVILGIKPRSLESVIPKCNPKNSNTCKTFILKETKIRNDETCNASPLRQITSDQECAALQSGKNTRQIEIPLLGTFNETVLPTQSKSQSSAVDLITVQEDKYSALRDIGLELNQEKNYVNEVNDDFGDFLSAEISIHPESESSLVLAQPLTSNPDSSSLKCVEKDDWGDWNFNIKPISNLTHTLDLNTPQTDIVTVTKDEPDVRAESDFFDAFSSLTVTKPCNNHKSFPDSLLQEQCNYFGENTNYVTIFDEKIQKLDDLPIQSQGDEFFSTQPDNEFWEFISTDIKPQSRDVSRHSSLPSLDLKISPVDESEQENVWRKCLDSCHSLIQEGYEIFNNIGSKCVLDEVFAAPKTEQYLNSLNIVFQISKRVTQNFNNFPSVQEELEKFWVRLQDLCFEYNIKLKHDEDNCSEGKIRCSICLRRIGYSVINQGTNTYHSSCANLWVNCVEPILPSSV